MTGLVELWDGTTSGQAELTFVGDDADPVVQELSADGAFEYPFIAPGRISVTATVYYASSLGSGSCTAVPVIADICDDAVTMILAEMGSCLERE